jgi:hypothetical protein
VNLSITYDSSDDLAQQKAAAIRALNERRFDLFESRLQDYVDYARAYLQALRKLGITFDAESARSFSFLDYSTANHIIDAVRDLIIRAINFGDTEGMLAASGVPLDFMEMSAEVRDFLFYSQMLDFFPMVLRAAHHPSRNAEDRRLLFDRSWRYPREFAEIKLPGIVESYDLKDQFDYFSAIVDAFAQLLRTETQFGSPDGVTHLVDRLMGLWVNQGWSNEPRDDMIVQLLELRRIVLLAVGGWSAYLYSGLELPERRRVSVASAAKIIQHLAGKFGNLRSLSQTYLEALDIGHSRRYLNNWVMFDQPESEDAFVLDPREWWLRAYGVLSLWVIDMPGEADQQPIPDQQWELTQADLTRDLNEIITSTAWTSIIPHDPSAQALDGADSPTLHRRHERVLEAHESAIVQYRRTQLQEVAQAELDPSRVEEFSASFAKSWRSESWLLTIFEKAGLIREVVASEEEVYLANHFLYPKDAFIKERSAIYIGIGSDLGAKLARDENRKLIGQIAEHSMTQEPIPLTGLPQILQSFTETCHGGGFAVIGGDYRVVEPLEQDSRFTPAWRMQDRAPTGGAILGSIR